MIAPIASALLVAFFGLFMHRRLSRYLHIFQQDDYDGRRFLGWVYKTRSFDRWVSLAIVCVSIAFFFLQPPAGEQWLPQAALALVFLLFAFTESNPTAAAKKPLVMTRRASNILWLSLSLAILAGIGVIWSSTNIAWVAAIQLAPAYLIVANFFLKPVERSIQNSYLKEARQRLLQIKPTIIGVTGSFGKTSVKHILGHILDLNARSFITPGSINTPMGITRVIRESLPADCQYFVVEMGAYGEGSIARLSQLTPPKLGIITAIGEAHYERFKSLDSVARAKLELATAVLKNDGQIVIHSSVLEQPFARKFVDAHRSQTIICGLDSEADVAIRSWSQADAGISVTIAWRDRTYQVQVPIYGSQHVGNIALAFAAAVCLGFAPELVVAALRTTPQIQHRLEIKPQANGLTYIDDAYNSNPLGFKAGLELMTSLAKQGQRKILVTPGMAELGEAHDMLHFELGAAAAAHVDLALIVRPERIPTFLAGFRDSGASKELLTFDTFAEANEWLQRSQRAGDIILLENDLPDLYEREFRA
jgi:UDP-N-acetylmuramoyl-tripeptide--D-alanyl-D-alanine ligase